MKRYRTRVLTMLISLVLVLALLPAMVSADPKDKAPEEAGKVVNFLLVGYNPAVDMQTNPFPIWLAKFGHSTEAKTAFDLMGEILDEAGYEYTYGGDPAKGQAFLIGVTPPEDSGFVALSSNSTGANAYWMWSYTQAANPAEEKVDQGLSEYEIQDGDTIRIYFTPDYNSTYMGHPENPGEHMGDGSEIKISFTLVGADPAAADGENPYEVWLQLDEYTTTNSNFWEVFSKILAENKLVAEHSVSQWGLMLQSITKGDVKLANGDTAFWMWSYLPAGESVRKYDKGMDQYAVQDGDDIRVYFTLDWASDYRGNPDDYISDPGNQVIADPGAAVPSGMTAFWPGFAGSMQHNAVKQMDFAFGDLMLAEVFAKQHKLDVAYFSLSDIIHVGGLHYYACHDTVIALDDSGAVAKEAKLRYPIDSTARLAYADGRIFVPLRHGGMQALTADELTTLWTAAPPSHLKVSAEDGSEQILSWQSLSTLTAQDGLVYQLNAGMHGWTPKKGVIRALDAATGTTVWEYANHEGAFYWAGGSVVDGVLVVGDDAGKLYAFAAQTGELLDSKDTKPADNPGAEGEYAIRTNVVRVGDKAYFINRKGVLNIYKVNAGGKLEFVSAHDFSDKGSSTSSPTVTAERVYFGLVNHLAYYDIAKDEIVTIDLKKALDAAADAFLEVKSTPLVLQDSEGAERVFFAINNEPGALYAFDAASETVTPVFLPAEGQENWCMASASVDPNGVIFYTNDSQSVFALRVNKKAEVPEPTTKPTETTTTTTTEAPEPTTTEKPEPTTEEVPVVTTDTKPDGPYPPVTGEAYTPVGLILLLVGLASTALVVGRKKEQS